MLLAALALAIPSPAYPQRFPERPVRIVVPYPITGAPDIQATYHITHRDRLIAGSAPPPITDVLAQIAVEAIHPRAAAPERLPGAVTTRGARAVLQAPPDGHTLLLASDATLILNPHYFHRVDYDPMRDFVAVAPLATMPFVLLVHSALPAGSVAELVRWLEARPGEINYGSSGDGSTGHLAGELFRRAARVHIVHASFHGGVAALNGLAQRQVSLMFAALPLALTYLPNDYFRALAVTGPRRAARLPRLPTLAEAGFPEAEVEGWYGFFVRAGVPPPALAWLRERITRTVAEPGWRVQLESLGLEPVSMTPGEFATRLNGEYETRAPVLRAMRLPLRGEPLR